MKPMTQTDHDLLIELRTEMQNIRNDIKELKDGTTSRIKNVEDGKVDKKDFDILSAKVNTDLEDRTRKLEESKGNYFTAMLIYTAVGVTMIGLILYHLFQSIPK
jgi:hypothetical protein